MTAKRPQIEKVSQTLTGATFSLAEKGPAEGDCKGQCTQKWFETVIFEGTLLRIVSKNVLPTDGGEHIFEKNMKNNDAKQECKQKCMLQLAFLMQIRTKVCPAQFFVSSLGSC